MAIERKFVLDGLVKAQLNEFLAKELERAGYGGMEIKRTPLGTQITVYAERPGMIIGKGGRTIKRLTTEIDRMFNLDNPQIDVQEVKVPELNPQMMASRLAILLEKGWYYRKAGHTLLRRIMEAGALGCEIIISGKLSGPRSRTQKFLAGYIKHSGKPSEELVKEGYAVAVKKLGVIGCKVRIVPPDIEFPDQFRIAMEEAKAEGETAGIPQWTIEEVSEEVSEEESTESRDSEEKPEGEEIEEVVDESQEQAVETEQETVEEIDGYKPHLPNEKVRIKDGTLEHKHEGYDYWHPVSRVHKR
ncbi:30S ribosomal protein S3 [Methanosarcinales archaeon]|nr:MAG: 30S ribosomal protein S3 [Methanosarcinales archaeon]